MEPKQKTGIFKKGHFVSKKTLKELEEKVKEKQKD